MCVTAYAAPLYIQGILIRNYYLSLHMHHEFSLKYLIFISQGKKTRTHYQCRWLK